MPRGKRQSQCRLALLATVVLATVAAEHVTGQSRPQQRGLVTSLDGSSTCSIWAKTRDWTRQHTRSWPGTTGTWN
jgi:hypothetical protein